MTVVNFFGPASLHRGKLLSNKSASFINILISVRIQNLTAFSLNNPLGI